MGQEMIFLGIGVAVLLIGYLLFQLVKSEKAHKETLHRLQLLENKINSTELQNIDARLNPHLFKGSVKAVMLHTYCKGRCNI
jgi:hypothetical protein